VAYTNTYKDSSYSSLRHFSTSSSNTLKHSRKESHFRQLHSEFLFVLPFLSPSCERSLPRFFSIIGVICGH